MAERQPTHNRPPPVYLDGCPECLTRDNRPLTTADSGGKQVPGVIATYFCNDCGHTWWTSWMAEVAE